MGKSTFIVLVVCLLLSQAARVEAADVRLFRYVNTDGSLVISHTIPSDKVAGGYDIIDAASGRLLERVPAQLTPEQLAIKQANDRERQACLDDLDRVHSLYSHEKEIDRALEEALASIDSRIKNAEANLTQLRSEQRKLEREAAQLARTGGVLSEILVNNLERAQIQIDTLDGEIAQRRRDKVGARERFAEDREIFLNGRCPDMVANF